MNEFNAAKHVYNGNAVKLSMEECVARRVRIHALYCVATVDASGSIEQDVSLMESFAHYFAADASRCVLLLVHPTNNYSRQEQDRVLVQIAFTSTLASALENGGKAELSSHLLCWCTELRTQLAVSVAVVEFVAQGKKPCLSV